MLIVSESGMREIKRQLGNISVLANTDDKALIARWADILETKANAGQPATVQISGDFTDSGTPEYIDLNPCDFTELGTGGDNG